ncbi:MAG: helix-turn-helix transcriptional regulator [Catenulispora sp.]|nr:helix-turn-helix transcriptional regulator [Catenulispora sp.]
MTELRAVPAAQPAKGPTKPPAAPEPLWREVLGEQLRELRRRHAETLAETAARAGISPQYLSEVERGLKEPSSEMIAAVAGALGTTLGGLAESVADELRVQREAVLMLRSGSAIGSEVGSEVGQDRRERLLGARRLSGPVALALAA